MKKIKGIPVSQGIVIGKAQLFNSKREFILKEKIDISNIDKEIKRFIKSLDVTKSQLKDMYENLKKSVGEDSALIIKTQFMILEEPRLTDEIKNIIMEERVKSEWAIKEVEKKYVDHFKKTKDLSFREKSNDIMDILGRIIANLKKTDDKYGENVGNVIIVADEIAPSIAATLIIGNKLKGIILDNGGETSHTVILARTLAIPTILNTGNATELILSDDTLIVDGITGEIIINPSRNQISKAGIKARNFLSYKEKLKKIEKLPNVTKDGVKFSLKANIEFPFESDIVSSHGADGIGLYRTEFLFMDSSISKSENEQYLIYKGIANKIYPGIATIRTFDIGRDKGNHYFKKDIEVNPALGMMAVRMFLKEKFIFKKQIKAIIRANENGNIRILFPMITEIEEIREIKKIIKTAEKELKLKNHLPRHKIKIGVMIEVPAMIKLVKFLKDEIDFFSLGSNDLIQYLLAVERNNSSLSYLFDPFQPVIIDSLFEIKKESDKIGKEVTVCGEIAGKTLTAVMLLGMGYTDLSMNPLSIAEIKRIFTSIDHSFTKKIVKQLPGFSSKSDAKSFLYTSLQNKYPELFKIKPEF